MDELDQQEAAEPLDEEKVEDLDEAREVIPFNYAITAYGADYPVDSLVKRVQAGDIIVPTFAHEVRDPSVVGFQREYVWPRTKADRFIESLLLGLPVPGVFLVKEPSGRFLVLDGHQRLYTLWAFYKEIIGGREYALEGVQSRFLGKRYQDLDVEDRRRLDDSIIHSTIVRQDEPTEDQSSIYLIFERLNTGGVSLQPQEIRVALYHGNFVATLNQLNDHPSWRALFGKKSSRLKDMELILRSLALLYYENQYRVPMKEFLNRYMASNRDLARQSHEELSNIFGRTVSTIHKAIGPNAFRPKRAVNAAVVDSVMFGISRRLLRGGTSEEGSGLRERYENLLANSHYEQAVTTANASSASFSLVNRPRIAELLAADRQALGRLIRKEE